MRISSTNLQVSPICHGTEDKDVNKIDLTLLGSRVKNITVGIKSLKTVMDDAKEIMKRLDAGKKVSKKKPGIYFENIDTMRKIITEERVRIIHVVKKEHPSSIYALAKLLNRDPKNVSDDVNYLAEVGLLELKKTKEGRKKQPQKWVIARF